MENDRLRDGFFFVFNAYMNVIYVNIVHQETSPSQRWAPPTTQPHQEHVVSSRCIAIMRASHSLQTAAVSSAVLPGGQI